MPIDSVNFKPPRWPGDTRPDFAPGHKWRFTPDNQVALKHGAFSEEAIRETIGELRVDVLPRILEIAPWLEEPAWSFDVELLLKDMAIERRLSAWILRVMDEQGPDKVSAKALRERTAASRNVRKHLTELGLTPRGYASIREQLASSQTSEITLEQLLEQGRQTRMGRQLRETAAEAVEIPSECPGEAI